MNFPAGTHEIFKNYNTYGKNKIKSFDIKRIRANLF